jgi:hypothetical protein
LTVNPATGCVVPTSFTFSLPTTATPGQSIAATPITATPVSTCAYTIGLTLGFAPNATGVPTGYVDPALQFLDTSGNKIGLTYSTTLAGLATSITLPQIVAGTVEGQISLSLTVLGQPNATASSSITVPAFAPIITPGTVQILNVTSSGFDVELVGNSSPRDLKTATFTFGAAAGASINGTTTFNVDVTSLMTSWYAGSASQAFGSRFLLTVPFTFSGSSAAISTVSVTLTNSVGTSAAATGTN